jgi:hypothetical protein
MLLRSIRLVRIRGSLWSRSASRRCWCARDGIRRAPNPLPIRLPSGFERRYVQATGQLQPDQRKQKQSFDSRGFAHLATSNRSVQRQSRSSPLRSRLLTRHTSDEWDNKR